MKKLCRGSSIGHAHKRTFARKRICNTLVPAQAGRVLAEAARPKLMETVAMYPIMAQEVLLEALYGQKVVIIKR